MGASWLGSCCTPWRCLPNTPPRFLLWVLFFCRIWISSVEQANVIIMLSKKNSTQFLSKYVQAKLEGPSFQMQLGKGLVVKNVWHLLAQIMELHVACWIQYNPLHNLHIHCYFCLLPQCKNSTRMVLVRKQPKFWISIHLLLDMDKTISKCVSVCVCVFPLVICYDYTSTKCEHKFYLDV